jgi:hypothetical protein
MRDIREILRGSKQIAHGMRSYRLSILWELAPRAIERYCISNQLGL